MKFLLIITLTLFVKPLCSQNVYINPEKLTWANFKGKPVFKVDSKGQIRDYVAFTWSWINLVLKARSNGTYKPIVDVWFCQDTSFVKHDYLEENKAEDKKIFQHELYHYKIAILYGKKAKQHLNTISILVPQTAVDIFRSYLNDHSAAQGRYDVETNHRHNQKKQKSWMIDIDKQLSDLSGILLEGEELELATREKNR
jgi:hypothetical protein